MSIITSISMVLSLILAVTIGPQTRPWSWGPAMLALGFSVITAIPGLLKKDRATGDLVFVAYAVILCAWFACRAWTSPVHDLAQSDLLLLASAIGFCVSTRAIIHDPKAVSAFLWGLTALLTANLVVMGIQYVHPSFTPIFYNEHQPRPLLQGFFGYYNENANFLIAASMFVASGAFYGRAPSAIRIFWGLLSITGIVSIWYTRSRGGILAAAIAAGVFSIMALIMAKRQNKPWFAHGVIALPIVGILSASFLIGGWQSAQMQRNQRTGIDDLMDNDFRLYMLGMAIDAIKSDPAIGGGSRSFSWDSYQLWDQKSNGNGGAKPDMVHHELLQAATDYGLIGAGLMVVFLIGSVFTMLLKTAFEEQSPKSDGRYFWRLGGISALAGMFVQSNFSFVFHLLPGVALFGICIAGTNWTPIRPRSAKTVVTSLLLVSSCVFCLWAGLPSAWKGSLTMKELWPSHYGKEGSKSPTSKVASLDQAIHVWPRYEFHLERAMILQQLAGTPEHPAFSEHANRAAADYRIAFDRHPYSPEIPVNYANLLSMMGRIEDAERYYQKALALQGQMESSFRAHYYYSQHLVRKSIALRMKGKLGESLTSAVLAAEQIEAAILLTPPWVIHLDGRNLRISIHENLGLTREAVGDRMGALAAYDMAASIQTGQRAHYRAAVLLGRMGRDQWADRRAPQALHKFIQARNRLIAAAKQLPEGVTLSQSLEFTNYLDRSIALLQDAKIEPKE